MALTDYEPGFVARTAGVVAVSTLLLTLAFLGLAAFARGSVVGLSDRVPLYVLVMATVFVVAVLALDDRSADGRVTLASTVGLSVFAFVLALLAGEGLLAVVRQPGRVLTSKLLAYLLAAGLICTGFGFWLLRHWREYVGDSGI
jgi:hypothetical protein